ncbi:putative Sm-like integral membrane protein [Neisseria flavescens]|uniref:Transporter, small conductance mechanosensitive ion channel MscS family protein n=1 Tax=Neisseria flavescens NRL30031/H210 TaxID=546264 RepID=C0EPX7_NEIFL|nr:hypothetical protein [Neisseria flavescens]EEG32928.1 transporter, small conductance mechanosensitive ion channel MscS family protein [Neisseria flavescens NRL30031/H210]SPY03982.1 putative Sm-like integral membrane protein [Neisseria meningitidis]SPY06723.1 putative Sm-like integral membrane protein [Neisseria meningitidis]STZ66483.1 putative Sm-like integral membrane protein [Neisseria flavescens]
MWNTIQEWLNALPVREEIIKSALMSVVMIVAVIAGRSILLSAHFRSHPNLSIENKRRSLVFSRNIKTESNGCWKRPYSQKWL